MAALLGHAAMVVSSPPQPLFVDPDRAARILREGGVVALPTETVYGLGASALDPAALARVFAVKRRPTDHPLIVHLASADLLPGWVAEPIAARAWRLAARFWPGPLTMVLPRGALASDAVTGGRDTVAVRVPDHPFMRATLEALGSGIAAPSANRFGQVSATTAADVAEELGGELDAIVDGGACRVGLESTIVDLSGAAPAILREGPVTREMLAEALGEPVADHTRGEPGARPKAPGQHASHYAPRARLEVVPPEGVAERVAAHAARGERALALGVDELGTTSEAWAANLYRALRAADRAAPAVIVVPTPPPGALAAALGDRLARASAPRP